LIYSKYNSDLFYFSFILAPLSPEQVNDNVTVLQSDSIPVSSDGGDIEVYNEDDAKKIDDDIIENGNEAQGNGKGLKL
jgi:hypothetical protein